MNRRSWVILLLAIGAVFVLAACSSGSSKDDAGGATDTTQATGTTKAGGDSGAPRASHAIVDELQKNLQELGYYDGTVDGVYGPMTTEAIKALQEDSGISVDGRWGPETQATIDAVLGKGNTKSDAVAELQVELRGLGFYDGEIDGLYGEGTTTAVTKAQEACDIPLNGIYGPETHDCVVGLLSDA